MSRLSYLILLFFAAVAARGQSGSNSIVERQYWIDGKVGERATIGASPATLDISSLNPGLHTVTVRVKDAQGLWSVPVTNYFTIAMPQEGVAIGENSIVERQYWIDGNVAARATIGASPAALDISSLNPGLHTVTVRVKDAQGLWSVPVTNYFTIAMPQEEPATMTKYMYWTDDIVFIQPTVGNLTDGSEMTIDCSSLDTGTHTIYWCLGDSKGRWSNMVYKSVFKYTLPESGIGTFSASITLDVHEDLKAGYATTYHDNAVTVAKLTDGVVPKNTGVLLYGTGNHTYLLTESDSDDPTTEGNALVAVVESTHVDQTDGDYTNFMMSGGKFIKIEASDDPNVKMPAHRAYLKILTSDLPSDTSSARGITLSWDDDATSISEMEKWRNGENEKFYDLQGRLIVNGKLSNGKLPKGLYINNGRKVVIK